MITLLSTAGIPLTIGFYAKYLVLDALVDRDYDIMMGSLALGTIIGQLGNLISDIAYAIVDPRIRFK